MGLDCPILAFAGQYAAVEKSIQLGLIMFFGDACSVLICFRAIFIDGLELRQTYAHVMAPYLMVFGRPPAKALRTLRRGKQQMVAASDLTSQFKFGLPKVHILPAPSSHSGSDSASDYFGYSIFRNSVRFAQSKLMANRYVGHTIADAA